MPKGRTADQLAKIRARRGPLSDVRRGRLLRQVEFAFAVSKGEPLTTAEVMDYCCPAQRLSFMGENQIVASDEHEHRVLERFIAPTILRSPLKAGGSSGGGTCL